METIREVQEVHVLLTVAIDLCANICEFLFDFLDTIIHNRLLKTIFSTVKNL